MSRDGVWNLYLNVASGTGQDERLMQSSTNQGQQAGPWTGGSSYTKTSIRRREPIYGCSLCSAIESRSRFCEPNFQRLRGSFSPDGRWMAYTSNETGRNEIYVQPFPPSGLKWPVSPGGGVQPRWRRDGKELFYVAGDAAEKSVMVAEARADGSVFAAGIPRALFTTRLNTQPTQPLGPGNQSGGFAVSADGQRFVGLIPVGQARPDPFTVVLNWTAGLKK